MTLRAVIAGAALVGAAAVSAACGGSSSMPTSPSGVNAVAPASQSFLLAFTPVSSTYTATLNGQTYTAAGGFGVTLAPGTYQISGSFLGGALGVTFAGVSAGTRGGVQSGSVRSLSGPEPTVESCRVLYFYSPAAVNGAPAVRQNFTVQFAVTTNAGSACQF